MARRIATIVEGHGEVDAVPLLIRRIAETSQGASACELARPIRVGRQRLLAEGELERTVELAARQAGEDGGILILLDADDDCPRSLAEIVRSRATIVRSDRTIRVVLAKREFESWFLAAAESLAGQRGLAQELRPPRDSEAVRGAKEWLSDRMPPGRAYRPTLDQASLTARFDLALARARAPSFDKLCRDVESLLSPPHAGRAD